MRGYYSEKVIWLPDCYQPNDPETPVDPVIFQRASLGLPEQATVFCSFNTDYKIEAQMFACWMRILRAVPGSVLWLIVRSMRRARTYAAVLPRMESTPTRLVFASPLPKPKHIARMRLADVALDTLPVNGHTTTTDALLAGIPGDYLHGGAFCIACGRQHFKSIGMDDLVAHDLQSYERFAVALAADSDQLRKVKTPIGNEQGDLSSFSHRPLCEEFGGSLRPDMGELLEKDFAPIIKPSPFQHDFLKRGSAKSPFFCRWG